jgi:preprotein translocase subunit SecB
MAAVNQENLKFKGVNFISLNYNCSKPWDQEEIILDVSPSIFLHKESFDSFEIIMDVTVKAEGSFNIETTAVGTFSIGENASEEYRRIFMHVNSPAIMFPYVRAFISTITSNFGKTTGTVTIPAQIFAGDLEIINPEDVQRYNEDQQTLEF